MSVILQGILPTYQASRNVAGLPEPEFAVSDGFQTIIRRTLAPSLAPQPESQPESLETRVLRLIKDEPKSKAELSRGLGQKEISGWPNKIVRKLLADRMIVSSLKNHKAGTRSTASPDKAGLHSRKVPEEIRNEHLRRAWDVHTDAGRHLFPEDITVALGGPVGKGLLMSKGSGRSTFSYRPGRHPMAGGCSELLRSVRSRAPNICRGAPNICQKASNI